VTAQENVTNTDGDIEPPKRRRRAPARKKTDAIDAAE